MKRRWRKGVALSELTPPDLQRAQLLQPVQGGKPASYQQQDDGIVSDQPPASSKDSEILDTGEDMSLTEFLEKFTSSGFT